MQSQSFSCVSFHIHIYIQSSSCLLESEDDRHIHTPIATFDLSCTNTHASRDAPFLSTSRSVFIAHTRKSSSTENWAYDDTHTYTRISLPTLYCLHKHTYSSWCISFSHLQNSFRYTQLAYLLCLTNYSVRYIAFHRVLVFQQHLCVIYHSKWFLMFIK